MYYIIEVFKDSAKTKLHVLSTENEFLNFEFDKDIEMSIGSTHLPIDNFINPFDLFFADKTDDKNLMYCLQLLNKFKLYNEINSVISDFFRYMRYFLKIVNIKN